MYKEKEAETQAGGETNKQRENQAETCQQSEEQIIQHNTVENLSAVFYIQDETF